MKALFITRELPENGGGGDTVVASRNRDFLRRTGLQIDEVQIPRADLKTSVRNVLLHESYGNTPEIHREIKRRLNSGEYAFAWVDGSIYGCYLRDCNRAGVPTICFYHNIEGEYFAAKAAASGSIIDRIKVPFFRRNEKYASDLAAMRILLNERDAAQLEAIYGKKGDMILPTTFDSLGEEYLRSLDSPQDHYLLFVGSNFWANQEGLEWFFKEVAPHINYKIKIVGSIAKHFEGKDLPDNVLLVGWVDDLDSYYANADAIISPILSGSGTKTKTIEALRYGKAIVGSEEALTGVPRDSFNQIGRLCSSPQEYIDYINSAKFSKINKGSLEVFEKYFSSERVYNKLKEQLIAHGFLPTN